MSLALHRRLYLGAATALLGAVSGGQAQAQRADENAVRAAQDAFGTSVGAERIGLYTDGDARGFSPVAAGNIRIEGLYIDNPNGFSGRLVAGSSLRVGIAAQGYPFPAPTGLADYSLRQAGDVPVVTLSGQIGPHGGHAVTVDTQQPIAGERLGFAGGATYRLEEQLSGAGDETYAVGGVVHWRATDRLNLQAFGGYFGLPNLRSAPLVFTDGAHSPPPSPARSLSPDWAYNVASRSLVGALATYQASEAWTLRAGLFRVDNDSSRNRTILLTDVQPDGSANLAVAAAQDQGFGSTSGEVRATWIREDNVRRHRFSLSARARSAVRTYGGSVQRSLGVGDIYEDMDDYAEPDFVFGAHSRDRVRQATLAASYTGAWAGVGEMTLGVQRADYRKTATVPGRPDLVSIDAPWLYDAALAFRLSDRLTAYAGYTTGLEESPVAPENAINRNEAPPALRTRQADAGVRYRLPAELTLVAGVFEVEKPYFNLDAGRLYRALGQVRHRGVELSVTGTPIDGLTLVAGAVFLDGAVSGDLVDQGQIGPRPVGQSNRQVRLNADYRLPWSPDWSIDLGVLSSGERAVGGALRAELGGEQYLIDGRTTVDIGARWRFRLAGGRAVARAQVLNIGDNRDWEVGSNGAFVMTPPRRVFLTITADF